MAQDVEKYGAVNGGSIEIGTHTTVANTIEVSTQLQKIVAALATYEAAPAADTRGITCDKTLTTHAVTMADAAVAAKKFRYLLIGI
jgi:hypothetical protein